MQKGRKKSKRKNRKQTQKGIIPRKENHIRVHSKEIQKVIRRGGMVEQLSIRRGSKLGHEILTLITFPESVVNSDIILLHQIFHILNQIILTLSI